MIGWIVENSGLVYLIIAALVMIVIGTIMIWKESYSADEVIGVLIFVGLFWPILPFVIFLITITTYYVKLVIWIKNNVERIKKTIGRSKS